MPVGAAKLLRQQPIRFVHHKPAKAAEVQARTCRKAHVWDELSFQGEGLPTLDEGSGKIEKVDRLFASKGLVYPNLLPTVCLCSPTKKK